jgi:hypothetical protein
MDGVFIVYSSLSSDTQPSVSSSQWQPAGHSLLPTGKTNVMNG